jgi:hypothetical protein
LVAQVAVVGTLTQVVVHWSLQHAPQEAVHSAIDEADVVVVVVVDASGTGVDATIASGIGPPSSVRPPSDVVVVDVVVVDAVADEEHEALHPD